MNKFVRNILSFTLLMFVAFSALDYFFSGVIKKSNSPKFEQWYDLMHGKIDSDIIFMGSSRTYVQVDPHIVDSILECSSYNLGMTGSHFNRQYRKYNLYREYNQKPSVIVQEIDYFTLDYQVGTMYEQFVPYFWNRKMRKEMISYEPFTWIDKYLPLERYFRTINFTDFISFWKSNPRSLYKGYSGKDDAWDGTKLNEIESIRFEISDQSMAMLHDYLSKAKTEGIKMVLVYPPLYYKAQQKIKNIDEMRDIYQRIADKYSIPILDYYDLEMCKDTAYFYNATHLNRKGAEVYSDSLAKDIKRLNLFKQDTTK